MNLRGIKGDKFYFFPEWKIEIAEEKEEGKK